MIEATFVVVVVVTSLLLFLKGEDRSGGLLGGLRSNSEACETIYRERKTYLNVVSTNLFSKPSSCRLP